MLTSGSESYMMGSLGGTPHIGSCHRGIQQCGIHKTDSNRLLNDIDLDG